MSCGHAKNRSDPIRGSTATRSSATIARRLTTTASDAPDDSDETHAYLESPGWLATASCDRGPRDRKSAGDSSDAGDGRTSSRLTSSGRRTERERGHEARGSVQRKEGCLPGDGWRNDRA